MISSPLRGKDRRYLRGLGNQLRPTVHLGKEGVSSALIRSLDEAHANNELVKVRLERSSPLERREAGDRLAAATESHLVQILGNTLLLYRPDPDEPKIVLPN
jgi:RNA-binding protein